MGAIGSRLYAANARNRELRASLGCGGFAYATPDCTRSHASDAYRHASGEY